MTVPINFITVSVVENSQRKKSDGTNNRQIDIMIAEPELRNQGVWTAHKTPDRLYYTFSKRAGYNGPKGPGRITHGTKFPNIEKASRGLVPVYWDDVEKASYIELSQRTMVCPHCHKPLDEQ